VYDKRRIRTVGKNWNFLSIDLIAEWMIVVVCGEFFESKVAVAQDCG